LPVGLVNVDRLPLPEARRAHPDEFSCTFFSMPKGRNSALTQTL